MSEEKLLYTQNGVFKRKDINNGLLMKGTDGFSSVTAERQGLYNISFDGTDYSFEAVAAGAGERMNTTYFYTDDDGSKLQVGEAGTIPVFTDYNTFTALNIPTDNQRYLLRNGQFIALQKTVKEQTDLASDQKGLIWGDNNTFKYLQATNSGNYFVKYNGSAYELVAASTNVSSITGSYHNNGLLFNNNNNFDVLTTSTSGNYYLTFDNKGNPSITAVPNSTTATKVAKSLRYTGKDINVNELYDLSVLSVTGDTSISTGKKYTAHISFTVYTSDYEALLDASPTDVYLTMETPNGESRRFYLSNPQPVFNIDTSILFVPLSNIAFNIFFSLTNNTTTVFKVAHDIMVDIIEV